MLSAVLHSEEAIDISGRIVDAFVAMRRFLAANASIFQCLEHIEYKLLENDHKFDQVFAKLEEKALVMSYTGHEDYDTMKPYIALTDKTRKKMMETNF